MRNTLRAHGRHGGRHAGQAIAQIQADGSFELFTRRPGDGVLPGKYAVIISVIKAPRDPVLLIDEKYTVSATTPYHETIEDDIVDLLYIVRMKDAANQAL
jgi:hypothetical protein